MVKNHFLFAFSIISLLLKVVSSQLISRDLNDKTLRNILLVNDVVLVGSNTNLYRLDGEDLSVLNTANLTGVNRLLLSIGDTGLGGDVLSCQEQSCQLLDSDSLTKIDVNNPDNVANADEAFVSGDDDLVGIVGTNEAFFIGRENSVSDSSNRIASTISKLSYTPDGDSLDLSLVGKQQENDLFTMRKFLSVFKSDDYVYFIYDIVDEEPNLRIARVCISDPGASSGNSLTLTTLTEASLECTGVSSEAQISSATTITIDNHILVLVTHYFESKNDICSFNVTYIDEVMNDQLELCKSGSMIPFLNLNRNSNTRTNCPTGLSESQKDLITPCSRGGVFALPLSVGITLSGSSILSFDSSVSFSSLASLTYENISYVIAGTLGGIIEQFYFIDDTTLKHIRTVNLTSSEAIYEIHVSDDKQFYFMLTSSSIVRYPVDVCDQDTSCQSCVESSDPLCGWCTLNNLCTKLSDCTTSPQIWTESNNECPVINSVEPSFVYTHQLNDTNVFFTINYQSIPNVTYNCVYEFADTDPAVVAEVVSNETIICPLPSINDLPSFGGNDTLSAELSLRTTLSVDVVDGQQVQFTDCSTQTTCFNCLSSTNKCLWCPKSLGCYSAINTCPGSNEIAINGTEPQDECPFIEPPEDDDIPNYLIHNLMEQSLVLRARNLQSFDPECVIEDSSTDLSYVLPAVVDADGVTCDTAFFNVSLSQTNPIFEAAVYIRVNNAVIENPSNTKIVFYSCPLMGENCGHCLSAESQFDCVYCKEEQSCVLSKSCQEATKLQGIDDFRSCESPIINTFYPSAGPLGGNTTITIDGVNLGAASSQVEDISIGEVKCKQIDSAYLPGRRIKCVTDETTTAIFDSGIRITLGTSSILSVQRFAFLIPVLAQPPVDPVVGPLAGGTIVTISGKNLGIGSSRSVTLAGQNCVIQNPEQIQADTENITCITSMSSSTTVRGQGAVVLRIDGYTASDLGFDYDNNPTFTKISPLFSFLSGGTTLTVMGNDLDTVQEPRLLFYDVNQNGIQKRAVADPIESIPCTNVMDSEMKCKAPRLTGKNSTTAVMIGLKMDNVQELLVLDVNITVYLDPTFNSDNSFTIQPGQTRNLTLTGQNFHFTLDQIMIMVTGDVNIPCRAVRISHLSEVVCEIEIADNADEGEYEIEVAIGNYERSVGSLTVDQPFNQLIIIISVFAVLVVVVIVIFIVSFSVFYRKYKQKDQQNDLLLFELDRLESSMAQECKLGFAELQTDVDELTGDLSGSRLPYHDFHVYLLQSLFPGAKDHPVLHELQLQPQKKVQTERALKDFQQIVLNKIALMTIIQTLEGQRAFTIRDKSNMGSLLMLALHDRLDYATEILKSLLSNLVRKTVADSYPKLLLRRTESVAEKMLSSWLAFTLHAYVVEHTGQPLYRLFKAVKAQLEKGPVDVVTGEARYSLSEQKLIRQQIHVTVINATVEAEDGLQIPVKLLDCDSISQAKEKMLDAVYKNAPVSQRPALTAIDIEYRRAPKEEGLILRDEDGGNDMESGWRKINTLSHYWIPDRAVFRLVSRQEKPSFGRVFDYTGSLMVTHGYRNRSISDAEDGWRVWHLFKQHEEDPRSSPFISKKMVTEIYLPRMLSTKTILQSFVDNLFNSIFTLSQPPISPSQLYTPINTTFSPLSADQGYAPGTDSLPVPIKYLFDFLDDEAANAKISDTDVLHTWKNNSLALRFWVNMIKNPEFVFDINKSAIVDSCLSVIAQAFIDGCSSSDAKPTINSPTSKLLFNKEVQGYKANVKRYYEQISELPRIPEEMMQAYLRDLSAHQTQLIESTGGFHTESALNEIMRYCIKYKEAILEDLRSSNLDTEAGLLESAIYRSM